MESKLPYTYGMPSVRNAHYASKRFNWNQSRNKLKAQNKAVTFPQENTQQRISKLTDLLEAKTSDSIIEEQERQELELAESEESFYNRLQDANISEELIKQYLNYDLYTKALHHQIKTLKEAESMEFDNDLIINMLKQTRAKSNERFKVKHNVVSSTSMGFKPIEIPKGKHKNKKDENQDQTHLPKSKRKTTDNVEKEVDRKTVKTELKDKVGSKKDKSSTVSKPKGNQMDISGKKGDKTVKTEHKDPTDDHKDMPLDPTKLKKNSHEKAPEIQPVRRKSKFEETGSSGVEESHSSTSAKAKALAMEKAVSDEKIRKIRKNMAAAQQTNFYPTEYADNMEFERAKYVINKLLAVETVEDEIKDPLTRPESRLSFESQASLYRVPSGNNDFLHFYMITKGITDIEAYLTYRRKSPTE